MAIDSRDKRAGAMGWAIMPQLPAADNDIGQADRQQVVGIYPGVLAGVPTVVSETLFRYRRDQLGFVYARSRFAMKGVF
jgi:hypothetical protein